MNKRICYHARIPNQTFSVCEYCQKENVILDEGKNPVFTIGFELDVENHVLFIAWAKPFKGHNYIKSFGVKTVNKRLDKMIAGYPDSISYSENMPKIVKQNINYFIRKAGKYFKEMNDINDINFWI